MARIAAKDFDISVLGVIMMDTYCPFADDIGHDRDTSGIEWGEATTEESKETTLKSIANSAKFSQQWSRESRISLSETKLPPAVLLRARDSHGASDAEFRGGKNILGWENCRSDFFSHIFDVPGNHYTLFADDNIECLSEELTRACEILEDERDD